MKQTTNYKKRCFMKGRIFIAIVGMAVMLSSVNVMGESSKIWSPEDFFNIKVKPIDLELGLSVPGTKGQGAGGDQQNIVQIDCTHNHGLVQIANAALPFYQTYAAMNIYQREIEADKTVELAKWQGYFDVGSIYAAAYASDPIYAMIQNGGGMGYSGYGGYNNYGGYYGMTNYYGSVMAGMNNPRWD
jgi:hypothetical protein